jgi:SAM-dependent methyltransferase
MPVELPEGEAKVFADARAPLAHLDFLNAAGYRAAAAAYRLNIFNVIGDKTLTAKEIAAQAGCDEHATGLLLGALEKFSYVDSADGGYRNSAQTKAFLLSGPYSIVFGFWQEVLFDLWQDLETSVRTGLPAVDFYRWLEDRPATLERFQSMLAGLCRSLTPEILQLVPIPPGPARILDVGGGHAGYSIALCQEHPELSATVLDLPAALGTGLDRIAKAGLSDRINGIPWDITAGGPISGGPYDLVLLFNIVHGYQPGPAADLVRRAAEVLKPGGAIVLLEPFDDPAPSGSVSGDAFVKLFSLNLFHGQGGRAYPYSEVAQWLASAGFGDPHRHPLKASPNDQLIIATLP